MKIFIWINILILSQISDNEELDFYFLVFFDGINIQSDTDL